MELRQLDAFVTVVRCKTFTLAAEELNLTQPAVTRSVASLEAELGTKLLDRLGRTVGLTSSGEALMAYAETILRTADEAIKSVRDINAGISGKLTLASSGTIATYVLPEILKRFGDAYPQVELQLVTGPSAHVEELVLANSVDFGLVMDNQKHVQITTKIVSGYNHVLVFGRDHSLGDIENGSGGVDAYVIADYPIITMAHGTTLRSHVEQIAKSAGIELNVGLIVDNVETIKRMVIAGLGIAILPDISVNTEASLRALRVCPIAGCDGVAQQIAAISRSDKYESRAMGRMIDMLMDI